MKTSEIMLNGLIKQNPVLKLVLGACSVLALSTSALNALGMGVAVLLVLVLSNLILSLLRKLIPEQVRVIAYVLIVATLVTIVQLTLIYFAATIPVIKQIYTAMGVYLPLIVVNCLILGRAEAFANQNGPLPSVLDGLFMGIGYTLAITLLGIIREFLAFGKLFGVTLIEGFQIAFFAEPAGAFLTLALAIAVFNAILGAVERSQQKRSAQPALSTEA